MNYTAEETVIDNILYLEFSENLVEAKGALLDNNKNIIRNKLISGSNVIDLDKFCKLSSLNCINIKIDDKCPEIKIDFKRHSLLALITLIINVQGKSEQLNKNVKHIINTINKAFGCTDVVIGAINPKNTEVVLEGLVSLYKLRNTDALGKCKIINSYISTLSIDEVTGDNESRLEVKNTRVYNLAIKYADNFEVVFDDDCEIRKLTSIGNVEVHNNVIKLPKSVDIITEFGVSIASGTKMNYENYGFPMECKSFTKSSMIEADPKVNERQKIRIKIVPENESEKDIIFIDKACNEIEIDGRNLNSNKAIKMKVVPLVLALTNFNRRVDFTTEASLAHRELSILFVDQVSQKNIPHEQLEAISKSAKVVIMKKEEPITDIGYINDNLTNCLDAELDRIYSKIQARQNINKTKKEKLISICGIEKAKTIYYLDYDWCIDETMTAIEIFKYMSGEKECEELVTDKERISKCLKTIRKFDAELANEIEKAGSIKADFANLVEMLDKYAVMVTTLGLIGWEALGQERKTNFSYGYITRYQSWIFKSEQKENMGASKVYRIILHSKEYKTRAAFVLAYSGVSESSCKIPTRLAIRADKLLEGFRANDVVSGSEFRSIKGTVDGLPVVMKDCALTLQYAAAKIGKRRNNVRINTGEAKNGNRGYITLLGKKDEGQSPERNPAVLKYKGDYKVIKTNKGKKSAEIIKNLQGKKLSESTCEEVSKLLETDMYIEVKNECVDIKNENKLHTIVKSAVGLRGQEFRLKDGTVTEYINNEKNYFLQYFKSDVVFEMNTDMCYLMFYNGKQYMSLSSITENFENASKSDKWCCVMDFGKAKESVNLITGEAVVTVI